jgi:very-short-patch-repair endonuclease
LVLAQLAARQHGVVALRQLKALGLSAEAARSRIATGRLHTVHRGVFAVGHSVLSREARWMAAVLAHVAGAALSHRSAAALWGIRAAGETNIDVTILRGHGRSRKRITTHMVRRLDDVDLTRVDGIPCTTIPRTLLDLADVLDRQRLERAIAQAELLGLFDLNALNELLGRAPGRRLKKMRSILAGYETESSLTESELEERFLALCLRAGLRRPRVNQWIVLDGGSVRADFLWPQERLIVETDGRHAHGTRHAFERDRERDQRLVLAGYRVVRFTWKQITGQPGKAAARVAELLNCSPAVPNTDPGWRKNR